MMNLVINVIRSRIETQFWSLVEESMYNSTLSDDETVRKPWQCESCLKRFKTKREMEWHESAIHSSKLFSVLNGANLETLFSFHIAEKFTMIVFEYCQ